MKEKERARLIHGLGFLALALMLMFAVHPVQAKAASYKVLREDDPEDKMRIVNNTCFDWLNLDSELYATKSGKRTLVYQAPDGYAIGDTIISNGSTVYFFLHKDGENGYTNGKCIFYSCTVTGKKLKKIATKKGWYSAKLAGIYKNNLYFTETGDSSYTGALYSLGISTGKIKKAKTLGSGYGMVVQSGKYFYFNISGKVGVYNAASGKLKTIVKNAFGGENPSSDVCVVASNSNYVYYLSGELIFEDDCTYYKVSVLRCRSDGSGEKTLVKNLKVDDVASFTSSSIIYYNQKGNVKTKKF